MITFRAARVTLLALLAAACGACSREQQDWRSAEAADTTEAYGRFLEQHGDSELAKQARARLDQLTEQRDWQHAGKVATLEAYREFLAQHATGRLSEEARIRIEAFSLGSAPRIAPQTPAEAAVPPTRVRALQLATAPAARREPEAAHPAQATGAADAARAQPGEAARATANEARNPPGAIPSGYGVQLGAFGSQASADREWQRLQGRFGAQLGGLSPRIVTAGNSSGQLYRLQVAAAGEAQARAICDSLKQQSQSCVPVLPR